jgi:hypothetical protein
MKKGVRTKNIHVAMYEAISLLSHPKSLNHFWYVLILSTGKDTI